MISLTVNGKRHDVDVPSDMPLLWVIRDILNLKGTKYGCGIGFCGACTVHMGGRAVRSCQTPVAAAEGAKITTIEGLSSDGSHPVQVAWQDLDVPQCGYCQAGQMMSAAALLAKTPKPTDPMPSNALRTRVVEVPLAIHRSEIFPLTNAETANIKKITPPARAISFIEKWRPRLRYDGNQVTRK